MRSNGTQRRYITAAVATLDRPDGLGRCLDALLSGEVLPAEVVVVDQSGDNRSQAVVERRRAGPVPIRYMRQAQRGLSASRNAAIGLATGDIIAFTDDDCVPDRGWIAAIERTFASPDAPAALSGRVLPFGPPVPGTYAVSIRESAVRSDFFGKSIPWLVGTGGNLAVDREWIDRVGHYDERLGAGSRGHAAEDAEYLYRLLCAGAPIRYEPEVLIYHERQSRDRRLASRLGYAHGIGTLCSLLLRRRDPYALYMMGYWTYVAVRGLVVAIVRRHWAQAHQESLSLWGMLRGLAHGLLVDEAATPAAIAPQRVPLQHEA